MARDVQIFAVTVPVGGTAAAPQLFAMSMPARRVVSLEVVIPDGVRGVVGFAIGSQGTSVIPSNAAAYISGNNEVIRWPLSGYIDSGNWQMQAYNLGSFPHTLQVRFLCELVQTATAGAPALIPAGQLTG